MEQRGIETVQRAVAYIEDHLNEKLDLGSVAGGVHYSKYHLHRMFTAAAGMTVHDYIRRRQLTEAARMLVFSEKPIMEAAFTGGYASQQAFTGAFRAMYKRTPMEYRKNRVFYPLQLEIRLGNPPTGSEAGAVRITCADGNDISDWMNLARLTVSDFPGFQETQHLEKLEGYIERRQALILRDQDLAAGAAAFSRDKGSIDFLAVHPQYRRRGVMKMLLDHIASEILPGRVITVTTFRQGDRADTGQRGEYKRLGFAEAELLTEFGYPTQRMVLRPRRGENAHE